MINTNIDMLTPTAGIRWRRQAYNSDLPGWVGTPYHADGTPWPTFRYFVTPRADGTLDAISDINPVGLGWDSTSITKPLATIEQAKAVCVQDWQESIG